MATLDQRISRLEDGYQHIVEQLEGAGSDATYQRSIRGRMHVLWDERTAREQMRRAGLARFSRGEALALVFFGLLQTTIMAVTVAVLLLR